MTSLFIHEYQQFYGTTLDSWLLTRFLKPFNSFIC